MTSDSTLKSFEISPPVISLLGTDKDPIRRRSQGTSTDLILFIPEKILQEFDLCFCSGQIPRCLCCLSAEPLRFLQLLLGQKYEKGTTTITGCLLHFFLSPRFIPLLSSDYLPDCPTYVTPSPTLSCAVPITWQFDLHLYWAK